MAAVLQILARLVFLAAALLLLLALLSLGLVVALVWWLVAALTGSRRPPAQVWVQRMQRHARGYAGGFSRGKRGGGGVVDGEVVDGEVREIP